MGPILFRLALITLGLGLVEIAIGPVLNGPAPGDWAVFAVAILVLVAGTAGFMGPLLAEQLGAPTGGTSK